MLRFQVSNMTCGGCANGVTRAVKRVAAAATVQIDLSTREVFVTGAGDAHGVLGAVRQAGYQVDDRSVQGR